jgi:hypothetical protein
MSEEEIIVRDKGDFVREIPPAGPINAVCWKVFRVGLQPNRLGPAFQVVVIAFETEYRYQTGDYQGKRWICYQKYRASLGKKAYLRRDLESWRGKPFDETELGGFNLKKIEGRPCLITLIHKEGYANLAAVAKLPPIYTPLKPETPDDYMPPYVQKLLDSRLPEEKDNSDAPAARPTKEEEQKMIDDGIF